MNQNFSISQTLVFLCFLATLLTYIILDIYVFGMNTYFLNQWIYHVYILQFFTSNFIHGGILHLVFNSIFIYYFWSHVEYLIGKKAYIAFFLCNAVFIWLGLTFLTPGVNTIWISWFALAIITYYTLHLKSIGNPEYTWWITAIVINILIGLSPQVSFLGHFLWMVFGGIYYIYHNKSLIRNKKED